MAYTTNYLKLQQIAARAVGLDLTDATADELALLAEIPNDAVDQVALARPWPRLVKALEISLSPGDESAALPADFQTLAAGANLNFGAGIGYAPPGVSDYDLILTARALSESSGPPRQWALGPTDDAGYRTIEFYPAADAAYTLVSSYRRRVAALAATTDTPDLPTALWAAVETATRMAARTEFNQEIPVTWEQRLARQIAEAWAILCVEASAPRTLVSLRGLQRAEPGVRRDLAADYP
jgi:hypothetical protein